MLKIATENDISAIRKLCLNSIIGTRILCYMTAYGLGRDFLQIWVIENNGIINGAIAKFYDDVSIITSDEADIQQISAFLDMLCFNSIMCSQTLCKNLGYEACILKKGYRFTGNTSCIYNTDRLNEDDMRDAYQLISREIPNSFSNDRESYLSFLSDYTFRERRSLARGVCIHIDGKIASVALTSSEADNAAIISGVACDRNLQKKGLGKSIVLSLVTKLKNENKEVYVIALNPDAEGFYEHIGFTEAEKIAFIERKNHV